MGRLIAIIQPKIIIALGYNAFTALSCLDGLPLTCHDPRADAKDTLADTMRGTYSLTAEGKDIAVFPVYHTGALGHRNRPIEQQKEDWRRIAAQMPLPQIPS